jgi:hypothetical protein
MYIAKFMELKRKRKFCHLTTKKIKSSAIDSKEFCEKNAKVVKFEGIHFEIDINRDLRISFDLKTFHSIM